MVDGCEPLRCLPETWPQLIGRIAQGGRDVIVGQLLITLDDLGARIPRCQEPEDELHRNSRAANARFADHDGRINDGSRMVRLKYLSTNLEQL
jgi:hypothetical protein